MIIYSEYFRHLKYVVKKCLKKYTCRDEDVAAAWLKGWKWVEMGPTPTTIDTDG